MNFAFAVTETRPVELLVSVQRAAHHGREIAGDPRHWRWAMHVQGAGTPVAVVVAGTSDPVEHRVSVGQPGVEIMNLRHCCF